MIPHRLQGDGKVYDPRPEVGPHPQFYRKDYRSYAQKLAPNFRNLRRYKRASHGVSAQSSIYLALNKCLIAERNQANGNYAAFPPFFSEAFKVRNLTKPAKCVMILL